MLPPITKNLQNASIYACLPFIEIVDNEIVKMGPIEFWPSSKIKDFIPFNLQNELNNYITFILKSHIKNAKVNDKNGNSNSITFVKISNEIPVEKHESLLIDALYLFYFSATFRNHFSNHEVPSFNQFSKIVPADPEYISDRSYMKINLLHENLTSIKIDWIDREITHAFGLALTSIYQSLNSRNHNYTQTYQLVRSIRFFVNIFIKKFENITGQGLDLSQQLFEPENVLFLTAAFESLLDIDERFPAQDFKQKLRPMLHLKYSKPVEIFWKWVDDFYLLRSKAIHGKEMPTHIFRFNPNFEVPYLYFGFKLFIYTVYYQLFKQKLIPSQESDLYTPPDFKWIHPEELMILLWPEENILRKISLLMMESSRVNHSAEYKNDVYWLTTLYTAILTYYYCNYQRKDPTIQFIPTHKSILDRYVRTILDHANGSILVENQLQPISSFMAPKFLASLKERVS